MVPACRALASATSCGQRGEGFDEVVDLVVRQREAEVGVRLRERLATAFPHGHMRHRLRRLLVEEAAGIVARKQHALGHPVVQQRGSGLQFGVTERLAAGEQPAAQHQAPFGHALDAMHGQAAVVRDVGRLRCPGRDRAQARRDDDERAVVRAVVGRAVAQQRPEPVDLAARETGVAPDPMDVTRLQRDDAFAHRLQPRQQGKTAKPGNGVAALEGLEMRGRGGHADGARCGCGNGDADGGGSEGDSAAVATPARPTGPRGRRRQF